jgi:AcrR family transcriptional regulator
LPPVPACGVVAPFNDESPMMPSKPSDADAAGTEPRETRERIKLVASEHYVLVGNDAFNFGHIAEVVGVTRGNIHHHFGSKRKLIAELVRDLTNDAEKRIRDHWSRPGLALSERLAEQLEDLRRFYQRFHTKPGARNVWSPLARIRLDLAMLDKTAAKALERINLVYDEALHAALAEAIASGELKADTPVDDIVRLLRVTFLSCPPITQDSGSFDDIERLFAALDRTVIGAWGAPKAGRGGRAGEA